MKHPFLYAASLLLASLTLGACSSDSDSENNANSVQYTMTSQPQAPDWNMDWSYNQEAPGWAEPSAGLYDSFSVMLVKLEDELQPYASDSDLMALFVGEELRGLASPAIDMSGEDMGKNYFLMKVYSNEADNERTEITMKYYNSRLKHIFSRTASVLNIENNVLGISEDFIPQFTLGSSKYPVITKLALSDLPVAQAGITPTAGDVVAAFVGEECRGVFHLLTSQPAPMTIYSREVGEKITLKYFDAINKRLFTFPDAVTSTQQQPSIVTIQ